MHIWFIFIKHDRKNSFAILPGSYKSPQVNGSWHKQFTNWETGKESHTAMKIEIGEDEEYLVWVKALLSLSAAWTSENSVPFYSLVIHLNGKKLKSTDRGQTDY